MRPSRAAVSDWLSKGPFAIAASTLQGGMNYGIVLYLSFGAGLAATGEYRIYFSYYSLFALVSMLEGNKVFIRSIVAGDEEAATAIVATRLAWCVGGFLLLATLWGVGEAVGRPLIPGIVVAIAAVGTVVYPFDLYLADLQARRRFRLLFAIEVVKYGTALALFVGLIWLGRSIAEAVMAQLVALAVFNVAFFFRFSRQRVRFAAIPRRLAALIRAPAAREARLYSFSNMFPASLEHLDKLAVGAVFGLEVLGVYTLAYSTGRFLYNILKPALYVYYRRFVNEMPAWPLLRRVSAVFTALGIVSAFAFLAAVEWVPAMARFATGRWATAILFLGYGLGILHAVYSQAFSLNRDSIARQSFVAHLTATLASLVLMGSALLSPVALALILLALQYPLRDGLSVWLMDRARRRGIETGTAQNA